MINNSSFALVRKVPITKMPISIEDVKSFLCIQNECDDAQLRFLIAISTDYAQWFTEMSLAEQTWQLTINCGIMPRKIYLPFSPLISISSIIALKRNEKEIEVIDDSQYFVDIGLSYVAFNSIDGYSRIEIIYVSGHTDPQIVPQQIRYGILHHTAISYKNRNYVDGKHLTFLKEIYFPFRALKLVL